MLISPVTSFRHSADSGSAKALTRSARPAGASASRMRSAWAWNLASQESRTARGETDGNIAARSLMCASPSLRIMLWPIRRFINPAGWCEENTSMRFSCVKMSVAAGEDGRAELRHERDRRLLPHPREIGIGIGPERLNVDLVMRGVGHGRG